MSARSWSTPRQTPSSVRSELESLRVKGVPAHRLAPGDMIEVQPSDIVPADARLLAAWDLEVDESG